MDEPCHKMNIYESLNKIKLLSGEPEIIELCDDIRNMCEDTFNGYIDENLKLYERLNKLKDEGGIL